MVFYLMLVYQLSGRVGCNNLMFCLSKSLQTNDEEIEEDLDLIVVYNKLIKHLRPIFIKPAKTIYKTPQRKTSLEKLLKWQTLRPT